MRNYYSLFVFAAILLSGKVAAQIPQLVNYQGRVAVDTVNFEGAGQFKFALVNSNGTTTFWSNDGTSAGGSEPTAAVTLVVAKGLYSVLLGDTTLGNMTTISASAFGNADVRLRVWFNDGAHGSQLLTPDQRLAPAAYLADGAVTSASIGAAAVTSGKIAPGAVSGSNVAPASLTSGNFATVGAPSNGQVLGYNNGGLTWTAPGGGVFSFGANGSAYYNGGNVGIGTTAPAATFESNGLVRSTRVGIPLQYIQLNGGDPNSINLTAQSSVAAEKNLFIENLSGEAAPGPNNNIQFVLGTTAARSTKMTLNKDGNLILPLGGSGGGIQLGTPNFETGLSIVGSNRADIRFDGSTLKLLASAGTGIPSSTKGITINASGNVGIGGSLTPVAKLEIVGQDALRLVGGVPFLTWLDSNSGYARSRIHSAGGEMFLAPESYLNGSDVNAYAGLYNSGNFSVKTLTIRGGADLAEPFAMSEHGVSPGTVVSIDLHHPGKLKMSATAYDRKVAGIVSGANGIKPGISMIDEQHLEAGENVALSGRVYVKANSSAGRIGPGDLLTTSNVPGEAMKAADHHRAQGSILGKAMTSLDEATGTVLVLVTLQ